MRPIKFRGVIKGTKDKYPTAEDEGIDLDADF
jgi:hypothetical protein